MTNSTSTGQNEWAAIDRAVARLRASIMAITFGLIGGAVLFSLTAWLVVITPAGYPVGPHLGLLRNYFPGYSVTWPGAFVGFFYGALVAGISGWIVALIYNIVAARRNGTLVG